MTPTAGSRGKVSAVHVILARPLSELLGTQTPQTVVTPRLASAYDFTRKQSRFPCLVLVLRPAQL